MSEQHQFIIMFVKFTGWYVLAMPSTEVLNFLCNYEKEF
jgi:hypothetical protein